MLATALRFAVVLTLSTTALAKARVARVRTLPRRYTAAALYELVLAALCCLATGRREVLSAALVVAATFVVFAGYRVHLLRSEADCECSGSARRIDWPEVVGCAGLSVIALAWVVLSAEGTEGSAWGAIVATCVPVVAWGVGSMRTRLTSLASPAVQEPH